jgi:hypothetical protein
LAQLLQFFFPQFETSIHLTEGMNIMFSAKYPIAAVKSALVVATAIASTSAMATFITYESRYTDNGVNRHDHRASWEMQTSAITMQQLSDFSRTPAPGSHHHSRLRVEFDAGHLANWRFQFAPDAGFGATLYVNDMLVDSNSQDMWWGYNWNRAHEILDSLGAEFTPGANVLDLYWAENCCNGGQSGRFSTNGGQDWMTLSVANLERAAVPEPGMLALMGTGVFGIALARRRRRG